MEFTIGETVEAVDQFGVWTTARIIEKRDDSVVVTFPQWKSEWDREISDASEVRKKTMEEVLIPRHLANNKSPNLKKLLAGDTVYLAGKDVTVCLSDPIRKLVSWRVLFG